jgi:hypothetical protein
MEADHRLLRYFEYEHLDPTLQVVSKPFYDLAHGLASNRGVVDPAELTAALRKLMEAKDCAVRSVLPQ